MYIHTKGNENRQKNSRKEAMTTTHTFMRLNLCAVFFLRVWLRGVSQSICVLFACHFLSFFFHVWGWGVSIRARIGSFLSIVRPTTRGCKMIYNTSWHGPFHVVSMMLCYNSIIIFGRLKLVPSLQKCSINCRLLVMEKVTKHDKG